MTGDPSLLETQPHIRIPSMARRLNSIAPSPHYKRPPMAETCTCGGVLFSKGLWRICDGCGKLYQMVGGKLVEVQ